MRKKFETWCYGGTDKAFFVAQTEAIHQYNTKILGRLLWVMTIVMGSYLVFSLGDGLFSKFTSAYLASFVALMLLLCTFQLKANKSVRFTKVYIVLFASVLFALVGTLGTVFEPHVRATLAIVYVLMMPMVFIIPTHYIYGFLSMVIGIFSIVALRVKDIACAQMDIVHLITCFVIGSFVARHILVNRMSLYAMNRQLENEIAERKREQEALRLQLEQHEIIMDQTTDILFKWDILKDDLLFSPNWLKKFGYEATGLKARGRITAWENIHPDDVQSFTKLITDTAAGKPYSEMEIRIQNIKGRYIWCRIRVTVQFSSEGQAIKAVGVILDVDEEKKEKYRLMKQAQRDSHTGLYNKAATNALVAHRMKDSDFTGLQVLMIIDIDCFKGINDTYGHAAGDGIIAAVAAQLRGHIRGNDVVGRIGGDEFLVYLAEVDSEEAALWKAQSLHAALNALIPVPGEPPITCSIGMAIFPHGTVEYSDLYQYADAALYQRKENGKNGVSVYDRQAGR